MLKARVRHIVDMLMQKVRALLQELNLRQILKKLFVRMQKAIKPLQLVRQVMQKA